MAQSHRPASWHSAVPAIDSRIVNLDPDKQYTRRKAAIAIEQCRDREAEDSVLELSNGKCWPKGPYAQQIEGVLSAVLTDAL